jgi:hypothetical protein
MYDVGTDLDKITMTIRYPTTEKRGKAKKIHKVTSARRVRVSAEVRPR